jgi:hypothetical protein
MSQSNPRVISIIMGGGRGTRLYPLTKDRCKPAVPLAGNYRLVDIPISNCLNSGLNRIYVLSQFNTASLHKHIQQTYKFDPFGKGFVDILAAEQTGDKEAWYQGTADAVRQNMHHYGLQDEDLVLILSGDQLYRMDFRPMIEQHLRTGSDITIAAKPMPSDQVSGLGIMRVDGDLRVTEFVEKPKDPELIRGLVLAGEARTRLADTSDRSYCLASMGIYLVSGKGLRAALADEDDRDAVVALELLRLEVTVEQDRARRTRRVRQLLRHERPAALEVGLLVIDVHRAARAAARASVLCEELGHDGTSVDARREGVSVLAVIRVLDVALFERVCNHRRDRLLHVVQVHEAANEPLHVCLVARVLELAAQLHHLVPAHKRTQTARVTAVDDDV